MTEILNIPEVLHSSRGLSSLKMLHVYTIATCRNYTFLQNKVLHICTAEPLAFPNEEISYFCVHF